MNQTSLSKYIYGDMSFFSFPPEVQVLILQKTQLSSDQKSLIKKCMAHNWWIHAKEMFPTLHSRGYRDQYISPEVMDNLDVAAQVMDPTGKFQDDILNILKADTIAMMKRRSDMTVFYEEEVPVEELKSVNTTSTQSIQYKSSTLTNSTSFPLYPSVPQMCMSTPAGKEKDMNGYLYSVAAPKKQSVKNVDVSKTIESFLATNMNQQSRGFGSTLKCYFPGSRTYSTYNEIELPPECYLLVRFVSAFGRRAILYQIKTNYATVIYSDDDATPGNIYKNDSSIRIGNVIIGDLKRFSIHGANGNWVDASVF